MPEQLLLEAHFVYPGTAAALWLATLALLALGYLANLLLRSPYSLWENVLYLPTYLFGRLMWHVHFANEAPPELQGGAILVANHRSSVDPFFVQLAARRRVHWMVAREYCENPVTGPLLRALLVIPTNRSGMDTGATKQAIRLAAEGRLVGMFPEGRLNHTRDPIVSVRSGAALVALRAGVPMIPIYIHGSPYRREVWSPLIMTADVEITFGKPIDPRAEYAHNLSAEASADETATFAEEHTSALEGPHNSNNTLANSAQTASPRAPQSGDDSNRKRDLAFAEYLIVKWGKQIVALAGYPTWPVPLAGRSRLGRANSDTLQTDSLIAEPSITNDSIKDELS